MYRKGGRKRHPFHHPKGPILAPRPLTPKWTSPDPLRVMARSICESLSPSVYRPRFLTRPPPLSQGGSGVGLALMSAFPCQWHLVHTGGSQPPRVISSSTGQPAFRHPSLMHTFKRPRHRRPGYSALSSPGGDTGTEEGEEARSRVSTFVAREGIYVTLTAEAYKLHVQMSAEEVGRRTGPTLTRWRQYVRPLRRTLARRKSMA